MENNELEYQLGSIDLLNFELIRKPNELELNEFTFEVSTQTRIASKHSRVFMVVDIDVRAVNWEMPLAKISVAIGYVVEPFETHIKLDKDRKTYSIPDKFENYIRIISISTVRGVLYSQLKGTYLHKAVMPIIPLDEAESKLEENA